MNCFVMVAGFMLVIIQWNMYQMSKQSKTTDHYHSLRTGFNMTRSQTEYTRRDKLIRETDTKIQNDAAIYNQKATQVHIPQNMTAAGTRTISSPAMILNAPAHDKTDNEARATSRDSNRPAHQATMTRHFAYTHKASPGTEEMSSRRTTALFDCYLHYRRYCYLHYRRTIPRSLPISLFSEELVDTGQTQLYLIQKITMCIFILRLYVCLWFSLTHSSKKQFCSAKRSKMLIFINLHSIIGTTIAGGIQTHLGETASLDQSKDAKDTTRIIKTGWSKQTTATTNLQHTFILETTNTAIGDNSHLNSKGWLKTVKSNNPNTYFSTKLNENHKNTASKHESQHDITKENWLKIKMNNHPSGTEATAIHKSTVLETASSKITDFKSAKDTKTSLNLSPVQYTQAKELDKDNAISMVSSAIATSHSISGENSSKQIIHNYKSEQTAIVEENHNVNYLFSITASETWNKYVEKYSMKLEYIEENTVLGSNAFSRSMTWNSRSADQKDVRHVSGIAKTNVLMEISSSDSSKLDNLIASEKQINISQVKSSKELFPSFEIVPSYVILTQPTKSLPFMTELEQSVNFINVEKSTTENYSLGINQTEEIETLLHSQNQQNKTETTVLSLSNESNSLHQDTVSHTIVAAFEKISNITMKIDLVQTKLRNMNSTQNILITSSSVVLPMSDSNSNLLLLKEMHTPTLKVDDSPAKTITHLKLNYLSLEIINSPESFLSLKLTPTYLAVFSTPQAASSNTKQIQTLLLNMKSTSDALYISNTLAVPFPTSLLTYKTITILDTEDPVESYLAASEEQFVTPAKSDPISATTPIKTHFDIEQQMPGRLLPSEPTKSSYSILKQTFVSSLAVSTVNTSADTVLLESLQPTANIESSELKPAISVILESQTSTATTFEPQVFTSTTSKPNAETSRKALESTPATISTSVKTLVTSMISTSRSLYVPISTQPASVVSAKSYTTNLNLSVSNPTMSSLSIPKLTRESTNLSETTKKPLVTSKTFPAPELLLKVSDETLSLLKLVSEVSLSEQVSTLAASETPSPMSALLEPIQITSTTLEPTMANSPYSNSYHPTSFLIEHITIQSASSNETSANSSKSEQKYVSLPVLVSILGPVSIASVIQVSASALTKQQSLATVRTEPLYISNALEQLPGHLSSLESTEITTFLAALKSTAATSSFPAKNITFASTTRKPESTLAFVSKSTSVIPALFEPKETSPTSNLTPEYADSVPSKTVPEYTLNITLLHSTESISATSTMSPTCTKPGASYSRSDISELKLSLLSSSSSSSSSSSTSSSFIFKPKETVSVVSESSSIISAESNTLPTILFTLEAKSKVNFYPSSYLHVVRSYSKPAYVQLHQQHLAVSKTTLATPVRSKLESITSFVSELPSATIDELETRPTTLLVRNEKLARTTTNKLSESFFISDSISATPHILKRMKIPVVTSTLLSTTDATLASETLQKYSLAFLHISEFASDTSANLKSNKTSDDASELVRPNSIGSVVSSAHIVMSDLPSLALGKSETKQASSQVSDAKLGLATSFELQSDSFDISETISVATALLKPTKTSSDMFLSTSANTITALSSALNNISLQKANIFITPYDISESSYEQTSKSSKPVLVAFTLQHLKSAATAIPVQEPTSHTPETLLATSVVSEPIHTLSAQKIKHAGSVTLEPTPVSTAILPTSVFTESNIDISATPGQPHAISVLQKPKLPTQKVVLTMGALHTTNIQSLPSVQCQHEQNYVASQQMRAFSVNSRKPSTVSGTSDVTSTAPASSHLIPGSLTTAASGLITAPLALPLESAQFVSYLSDQAKLVAVTSKLTLALSTGFEDTKSALPKSNPIHAQPATSKQVLAHGISATSKSDVLIILKPTPSTLYASISMPEVSMSEASTETTPTFLSTLGSVQAFPAHSYPDVQDTRLPAPISASAVVKSKSATLFDHTSERNTASSIISAKPAGNSLLHKPTDVILTASEVIPKATVLQSQTRYSDFLLITPSKAQLSKKFISSSENTNVTREMMPTTLTNPGKETVVSGTSEINSGSLQLTSSTLTKPDQSSANNAFLDLNFVTKYVAELSTKHLESASVRDKSQAAASVLDTPESTIAISTELEQTAEEIFTSNITLPSSATSKQMVSRFTSSTAMTTDLSTSKSTLSTLNASRHMTEASSETIPTLPTLESVQVLHASSLLTAQVKRSLEPKSMLATVKKQPVTASDLIPLSKTNKVLIMTSTIQSGDTVLHQPIAGVVSISETRTTSSVKQEYSSVIIHKTDTLLPKLLSSQTVVSSTVRMPTVTQEQIQTTSTSPGKTSVVSGSSKIFSATSVLSRLPSLVLTTQKQSSAKFSALDLETKYAAKPLSIPLDPTQSFIDISETEAAVSATNKSTKVLSTKSKQTLGATSTPNLIPASSATPRKLPAIYNISKSISKVLSILKPTPSSLYASISMSELPSETTVFLPALQSVVELHSFSNLDVQGTNLLAQISSSNTVKYHPTTASDPTQLSETNKPSLNIAEKLPGYAPSHKHTFASLSTSETFPPSEAILKQNSAILHSSAPPLVTSLDIRSSQIFVSISKMMPTDSPQQIPTLSVGSGKETVVTPTSEITLETLDSRQLFTASDQSSVNIAVWNLNHATKSAAEPLTTLLDPTQSVGDISEQEAVVSVIPESTKAISTELEQTAGAIQTSSRMLVLSPTSSSSTFISLGLFILKPTPFTTYASISVPEASSETTQYVSSIMDSVQEPRDSLNSDGQSISSQAPTSNSVISKCKPSSVSDFISLSKTRTATSVTKSHDNLSLRKPTPAVLSTAESVPSRFIEQKYMTSVSYTKRSKIGTSTKIQPSQTYVAISKQIPTILNRSEKASEIPVVSELTSISLSSPEITSTALHTLKTSPAGITSFALYSAIFGATSVTISSDISHPVEISTGISKQTTAISDTLILAASGLIELKLTAGNILPPNRMLTPSFTSTEISATVSCSSSMFMTGTIFKRASDLFSTSVSMQESTPELTPPSLFKLKHMQTVDAYLNSDEPHKFSLPPTQASSAVMNPTSVAVSELEPTPTTSDPLRPRTRPVSLSELKLEVLNTSAIIATAELETTVLSTPKLNTNTAFSVIPEYMPHFSISETATSNLVISKPSFTNSAMSLPHSADKSVLKPTLPASESSEETSPFTAILKPISQVSTTEESQKDVRKNEYTTHRKWSEHISTSDQLIYSSERSPAFEPSYKETAFFTTFKTRLTSTDRMTKSSKQDISSSVLVTGNTEDNLDATIQVTDRSSTDPSSSANSSSESESSMVTKATYPYYGVINLLSVGINVKLSVDIKTKSFKDKIVQGLEACYTEGMTYLQMSQQTLGDINEDWRRKRSINWDVELTTMGRLYNDAVKVDIVFFVKQDGVPLPSSQSVNAFNQLSDVETSALLRYPIYRAVSIMVMFPLTTTVPPEDSPTEMTYILVAVPIAAVAIATVIVSAFHCYCRKRNLDETAISLWKKYKTLSLRKPTLQQLDLSIDVERGEIVRKLSDGYDMPAPPYHCHCETRKPYDSCGNRIHQSSRAGHFNSNLETWTDRLKTHTMQDTCQSITPIQEHAEICLLCSVETVKKTNSDTYNTNIVSEPEYDSIYETLNNKYKDDEYANGPKEYDATLATVTTSNELNLDKFSDRAKEQQEEYSKNINPIQGASKLLLTQNMSFESDTITTNGADDPNTSFDSGNNTFSFTDYDSDATVIFDPSGEELTDNTMDVRRQINELVYENTIYRGRMQPVMSKCRIPNISNKYQGETKDIPRYGIISDGAETLSKLLSGYKPCRLDSSAKIKNEIPSRCYKTSAEETSESRDHNECFYSSHKQNHSNNTSRYAASLINSERLLTNAKPSCVEKGLYSERRNAASSVESRQHKSRRTVTANSTEAKMEKNRIPEFRNYQYHRADTEVADLLKDKLHGSISSKTCEYTQRFVSIPQPLYTVYWSPLVVLFFCHCAKFCSDELEKHFWYPNETSHTCRWTQRQSAVSTENNSFCNISGLMGLCKFCSKFSEDNSKTT